MSGRIRPIADVNPVYERESSIYPDCVRIAMENGTVVTYARDERQTPQAFKDTMELIRKWNEEDHGYQYSAKHERKPNIWERILKLRNKGVR